MSNTTTWFTVKGPYFGSEEYRSHDAANAAIRDVIAYRARVFGVAPSRDSFEIERHVGENLYRA